jgi:hypothetical protein
MIWQRSLPWIARMAGLVLILRLRISEPRSSANAFARPGYPDTGACVKSQTCLAVESFKLRPCCALAAYLRKRRLLNFAGQLLFYIGTRRLMLSGQVLSGLEEARPENTTTQPSTYRFSGVLRFRLESCCPYSRSCQQRSRKPRCEGRMFPSGPRSPPWSRPGLQRSLVRRSCPH